MKKILSVILAGLTFFTIHNTKAEEIDMTGKKVLVVYFSKTGEQYGVGNITEGNTAIIAKMVCCVSPKIILAYISVFRK